MRVFFDTEFIENGKTIELISLAAVREDGKEFYEVNSEMPYRRIKKNHWLMSNVMPSVMKHLQDRHNNYAKRNNCSFNIPAYFLRRNYGMRKSEIAAKFLKFCGENPEFYAYFAAYDWVLLCQLYGTMIDLPKSWPMYCRDLKQIADEKVFDSSNWNQDKSNHDALQDSLWNKALFDVLK